MEVQGLGPMFGLMWPYIIYSLIVTMIYWAFMNFFIGKKVMYDAPEDTEEWDEDNHFEAQPD